LRAYGDIIERSDKIRIDSETTESTETSKPNNTANMSSNTSTSLPTPTPITKLEDDQFWFVRWILFIIILAFVITSLIWGVWYGCWKRKRAGRYQRETGDIPLVLITPGSNGNVRLENAVVHGDRRAWTSDAYTY
jgi:hypothetical protein